MFKYKNRKNNLKSKIKTEILCLYINITKGIDIFLKYANILGRPTCSVSEILSLYI